MIERKSDENNKKNTDQDKDIKVLENANQKLVSTTSILQNSFEDLERDLEKKESLDRNQEEKLLNLANQSQNLFSTTTILQNTMEYLKRSERGHKRVHYYNVYLPREVTKCWCASSVFMHRLFL